ncbi:MAG: SCP2 sterol-binding domain-containing protein [Chloroflexi bacterium]|nr:SCP2 sterol-binding domain-containing protein [Chloroflexota bacterium]
MPFFTDSDQFYTCAKALFDRLQAEYPGAADAILDARLLISFACTNPDVVLLINGRRCPVEVVYGPNRIRPELEVNLSADTLHQILLGEISLPKALSSKLMKVKGPVWKTLALASLFERTQLLYPQVLRQQGLWPS